MRTDDRTPNRRLRRAAVALVVLALSAAACSSGTSDSAATSSTTSVKDRPPTTITLWSSFGDTDTIAAFKKLTDSCQRQNPWLTIDYVAKDDMSTALAAAAESGKLPDLVQADFTGGLAKLKASKAVLALDDLAKRDGFDWNQFAVGGQKLVTFDGQRWGIPFSLDTAALFYNQDALDEVGLKPPTSFDEIENAARKLISRKPDGSLSRIGFVPDVGDGSFVVPSALLFGGQPFNDDGTKVTLTDTSAWADSLRWQRKLYDLLGDPEEAQRFLSSFGAYDSAQNFFITGQVPLYLEASYFVTWPSRFGNGKPARWGVTPMPGPKGVADAKELAVIGSGNSFFIPAKATDTEVSWIAARCLATSAEDIATFQEFNGNIPANLAALDSFEKVQVAKIPAFKTFIDLARSPKAEVPNGSLISDSAGDQITQLALKFRRGQIPDDRLDQELSDLQSRLQDELDLELGGQ